MEHSCTYRGELCGSLQLFVKVCRHLLNIAVSLYYFPLSLMILLVIVFRIGISQDYSRIFTTRCSTPPALSLLRHLLQIPMSRFITPLHIAAPILKNIEKRLNQFVSKIFNTAHSSTDHALHLEMKTVNESN